MKVTTNDKGDIGVAKVIADLTERGIKVALPTTHGSPFDLIAISTDYKLSRVSVKYLDGKDRMMLPLRTISACSKQVVRRVNMEYIDAYAAYSPVTKRCYYVHKKEIVESGNNNTFGLRITVPMVRGGNIFRMSSEYEDVSVLFSEGC